MYLFSHYLTDRGTQSASDVNMKHGYMYHFPLDITGYRTRLLERIYSIIRIHCTTYYNIFM